MNHQIFVYADLDGIPYLVGILWTRHAKMRESATFEYNKEWLEHPLVTLRLSQLCS